MIYDHKTQVGGTHYSQGEKPQHWDLVLMYNWDYFQAQVIKYLMRWKYKYEQPEKRLEDLKKARNFLDKYIAEEERKLGPATFRDPAAAAISQSMGQLKTQLMVSLGAPKTIKGISSDEHWSNEGYFGDDTQLYKCRHCKSTVRMSATPPPHGCTPTPQQEAAQDTVWPPLETGNIAAGAVLGSPAAIQSSNVTGVARK